MLMRLTHPTKLRCSHLRRHSITRRSVPWLLGGVGDQLGHVEAFDLPVDHPPLTTYHHAVGLVGTAQQQRGNRVVAAGETQFV